MSDFIAPNSERAIQEAANLGLDVVFPQPSQLQIDIDDVNQYWVFHENLGILEQHIFGDYLDVSDKPSRNDGAREDKFKRHVTVNLPRNISNVERIMFQALLGSDPKREILSLVQELAGDPHPTLFLEKRQPLALPENTSDVLTDDIPY